MDTLILVLALVLLLAALLLFRLSGRLRQAGGLPPGRIIYTDTRGWGKLEKPLYDPVLGLTGKPDYLVQQAGNLIPVEVKTGRTPDAPHDSHMYQLAAYCLLVERTYGKRPTHGILHYPGRDFAVDYTPDLESALLSLLADIKQAATRGDLPRSHNEAGRCHGCGFRGTCDQKLA